MTRSWSRRTFLRTTGGTALALGLTAGPLPADQAVAASASASASAADFSALRAKWRTLILGEGFSPTAEPFRTKLAALGARAGEHRSAMAPATGSLWPDLVWADPEPDTDQESFGYSARLVDSLNRLSTMAQAYCQQGTGLTGNAALRDAVVTGLDHIHARVYHENQARYGNWWSWQIGGPQALLDVCVLMYDQLSATQIANHCRAVDHFVPDSAVAAYTGTSTGANRVDLCRVLILRGIVGGSAAKIALGRDALSPVFPYVTSGDGLYADGSFVQHGTISYTGSYGAVMLGGLGALFSLLAGSGWAVTDPGRQIVLDAVENMPITAPPEPGADARFSMRRPVRRQHRAVHAPHLALGGERLHVPAQGHGGDAEFGRELCHPEAAALPYEREHPLMALVDVQSHGLPLGESGCVTVRRSRIDRFRSIRSPRPGRSWPTRRFRAGA